ncbi:MAG: hypothetical protein ABW019_03800 [Chitinophagaceae bacterium]
MDTFLEVSYSACLLLSIILAVTNRKALKSRQLFFFIPYLCLVLAQELVLAYIYTVGPTGMIYNFYRLITTIVFTLFFYFIPVNTPSRRIIAWLLGLYLAVWAITFGLLHSVSQYNSYLSMGGGLVITASALLFLLNYFNLDNRREEKNWLPVVWVTIGMIVYFPVVNVALTLYKYIYAYQATIFDMLLYNAIPQLMSIFMYSCFTYAFYLCQKKN